MTLLALYTLFVVVGEGLGFFAGLWLDRTVPDYSIAIYATLFFGILIGAWPAAVNIDERLFPGRE